MAEIREIMQGETPHAAEALLSLRPRWETAEAIVDFVDNQLRPAGYRLVGAFREPAHAADAVAGFRELWSTAWGHYMYIDDVSTLEMARGNGFGDQLLNWIVEEAQRRQCDEVHLDSGVGRDRATAHRLYMRHRMRISAHHFSLELEK